MRKICQFVFIFTELREAAKEKARQWFREASMHDEWWDSVYEDAANIADILGIDLRTRKVSFKNGTTRYDEINILFSGFSCQGDGAQFNGNYRYAKGATKRIREYAPEDVELHRIADSLQALQRKHFYAIKASVKHDGHYSHQYCTNIDVTIADPRYGDRYPSIELDKEIKVLLRDFMQWIYRTLENEHDLLNSDESIDDQIINGGYEFTAKGTRKVMIGECHG